MFSAKPRTLARHLVMRSSFYLSSPAVTKPTCQSRTGVHTRDLILSAPVLLHTAPVYPRRYTCVASVMLPFHTRSRGRDDNAAPHAVYLAGECTRVPHAPTGTIQITFSENSRTPALLRTRRKFSELSNRYNGLYLICGMLKEGNSFFLRVRMKMY